MAEISLLMHKSHDTLALDISAQNWCLNETFVKDLAMIHPKHQFEAEMSETKVSWLLYIGRLVSKTDSFAHLVKQVSVDYVSMRNILLSKESFMVPQNVMVEKTLINIHHAFNIILPKPCESFVKSLTKIQVNN